MLTLALLIGLCGLNSEHKQFANTGRYDEAIAIRNLCKFSGEFFFYQAISYFKIKEYQLSKRCIEQALFYKDLPERYSVVLSLLMDEIESVKERKDKIQDISTDMEMVRQRLENNKAGIKTQAIQKKIINKLDEQIKNLEDEMNKANQESQASKSNPTEGRRESGIIEEAPPKGEISNRKLGLSNEQWGSLPPKEKMKALEIINRSLPPHIMEAANGFSKKLQNGGK